MYFFDQLRFVIAADAQYAGDASVFQHQCGNAVGIAVIDFTGRQGITRFDKLIAGSQDCHLGAADNPCPHHSQ